MATILQQQLAAIAAKSTHQLDLRAQRVQHSKSLLFEPRVAAGQSLETIYHICLDGFRELCMLDARFNVFADNLFSPQSKSEDRTQMSSQENADLDTTVQNFLRLVSGRLLLNPAQKAVEWLVRRFSIHDYNTEYFILTFLPYHANEIFPTMLSILPKQIPPNFRFLQPYIASLACPPRRAILYTTVNNPALFSAISQFMIATATQRYHSAILVGFWASITAQSVHGQLEAAQSGRPDVMKQRQEDVLLRTLPILQQAFSLKNNHEVYLGACMIVTILVAKARLEGPVLDSLMDAVAFGWSSQTVDDGLVCLCVIAAERQSPILPPGTLKSMLKDSDLAARLARLCVHYNAGSLYQAVCISLITSNNTQRLSESRQLVSSIFELDDIDTVHKGNVARAIVRRSLDRQSDAESALFAILQHLAMDKRTILDAALSSEQISYNDLESHVNLVLDRSTVEMLEDATDDDLDMVDAAEVASEDTSVEDLRLLHKALDANTSALDRSLPLDYARSIESFSRLCRNKIGTAMLSKSEALTGQNALSTPGSLSLLARVWSRKNSPASARLTALRLAVKILKANSDKSIDMQALLPYLVSALSDEIATVRRAAAELILAAIDLYHVTPSKGKLTKNLDIWARAELYNAQSSKVKVRDLTSQDAYKVLTTVIAPVLEECILDSSHLTRVLVKAINAADTDSSLKTATRTSVHDFLCSHAVLTPVLTVCSNLLTIIARVGKVGTHGRESLLIPSIKAWARLSDHARQALCEDEGQDALSLDKQYLDCLGGKYPEELKCLRELAEGSDVSSNISSLAFARITSVWSAVKPAMQSELAINLLNQSLDSPEVTDSNAKDRHSNAKIVLRDVSMSTEALTALLDSVPDMAQMVETQPTVKRRRTSKTEGSRMQAVNTAELQKIIGRLTLVLEIVEANKPEKHTGLLKALFRVLGELQNYRIQLGSDLVYLQQMVIGSLLSIVDVLKDSSDVKADRSILRTDLIVECVRSTSSTVVHNSALLLISSLASWVPDLVLHSVMPIFTFMSATILRQSDDYSAHIIDQTVSRVVPPLIKSLRKRNQDLVLGASELLLSFTAAFEHIPVHRRLRLFSHLVEVVGPDESLAAIIAMLSEKYPTDSRVPQFIADLCGQFPPLTQLKAAITYLDLVGDALQSRRVVADAVFALSDKTPEQIDGSIQTLLIALSTLLKQQQLHDRVNEGLGQDAAVAEQIEATSATLLERALGLTQSVMTRPHLVSPCGSIVASCLGLLPTSHFVNSALSLIEREDEKLGQIILRSFEQRSAKAALSDDVTRSAMLRALPAICNVITADRSPALKCSAIRCVDHITERYGKKDVGATLSAFGIIASDKGLGDRDAGSQTNSLLCLSTMVGTLGDDMVAMLPNAIERTLNILARSIETHNKQLFAAGYSFVCAIMDRLAFALSSRTLKQILLLCFESAAQSDIAFVTAGAESRMLFARLASSRVELRIWLKAILEVVGIAPESGTAGCQEMLLILETVVSSMSGPAVVKHASTILAIVQQTFDWRRVSARKSDSTDDSSMASLDTSRDTILLDVVMKMNDKTFRPHFVSLFDWTQADVPLSALRRTGFYTFLGRFFETLKSIVTSYTSYILDDATTLLSASTSDGPLVAAILAALTSSFKHDQEDFFRSPDTFKRLSDALLTRLGKLTHNEASTAAITELAAASGSTEQHAVLNSALLKWTRSPDARLRLVAVRCEQSLTQRLGEDWLAVLPEMLPFISELQEDEDETVERETLRWIQAMEGILGESLDGMLQ